MDQWTRVCAAADLPDPGKGVFEVDDRFVVLFHVGGRYWALEDRCTHDDGPLGEGTLQDHVITCPRHGAQFDIRNGRVLRMPATRPTASFPVKVEGDDVFVKTAD